MKTFSVKVEKSGRVLIPVAVRRMLHLQEGESHVLMTVDESGLALSTRQQALSRVRATLRQYIPEGSDVTSEFLADRRREAERESK
jgi:bifunctional DNA-binding transcriptional regulator/antitoxin component of YhaV-PrlF toxin-antitoxin module